MAVSEHTEEKEEEEILNKKTNILPPEDFQSTIDYLPDSKAKQRTSELYRENYSWMINPAQKS